MRDSVDRAHPPREGPPDCGCRLVKLLVLTVKSMMTQFQKELWARFSIPLVRLDSTGLQQVRAKIPGNHNPFNYYDKTIISIDTVKQDGEYRNHLETAFWDVIVIDEAHNVARRGTSSLRARVAELLSSRSDSLILLSATPHDGRRESFASIMNMLNPTAIRDETNYGPEDIEGLFIRRFKKDIADQIRGKFPERQVHIHRHPASPQEESAYSCLTALTFQEIDRVRQGGVLLFKTLLEKSLFSSPAACLDTLAGRIRRIRQRPDADRYHADVNALNALQDRLNDIGPQAFSKYQALLTLLRPGSSQFVGWNPGDSGDRLVIFTERIATLNWLAEHLPRDLGLSAGQTGILHGGMSDSEQQELVEAFGSQSSAIRLLLASDVASEGINLHYFCHRLIHFDIPWSLLTFQQRNGRIDRYGQEQKPRLHYLLTDSRDSKIHGDQRILEILVEKDRQVQENIGDPSEFTGLHTPEEEEASIARAMESGMGPDRFDATFGGSPQTDDPFLAALLGQLPTSSGHSTSLDTHVAVTPSFFPDEYAWAKEAIAYARTRMKQPIQVNFSDSAQEMELVLPKDLVDRLQRLPDEIRPRDGIWFLTPNRKAVMNEMAVCRRETNRWPRIHLLWQQHPAMEWLHDKILCAFGRQDAPVVQLDTLQPDESIFLTTGILPNRNGHPLIQRWTGIRFIGTTPKDRLNLEQVMAITGFGSRSFPNPETEIVIQCLQRLISPAVDAMQAKMQVARLREQELEKEGVLADYLSEYEEFEGAQNFLNALQNYPLLKGQQTNLYKCFITRAWDLVNSNGAAGFLHPEGVYDDPNGGPLRRELYPRLRYHFQFQIELQLFAEVDHHAKFSINIYQDHSNSVRFQHIANLFSVGTVDMCFEHGGLGQITGIKGDDGQWATNGHKDRIIPVDEAVLSLFAKLYDVSGTPAREARLPSLHARQLVAVLKQFADYPDRLGDMDKEYFVTQHWNEVLQQHDVTMARKTCYPKKPEELILSGPHFFVGNPLNKTPREVCTQNSHYDVLDLETLPDDYLPRTNYVPDCDMAEYRRRTPTVPWGDHNPVTNYYRYIHREMLSQSGERTLIPTIVPPGVGLINTCLSCAFENLVELMRWAAISITIPVDFRVKTTGMGHANISLVNQLPVLPENIPDLPRLFALVLILNCLTTHYADLWAECWDNAFQNQRWFGDDHRLDPDFWRNQTPQWQRNCALRTDFPRRWALVELDVLAARTLGLALAELQTIYRIQFPVLRQYEADTWYDQKGRIVFTCSKGLPGVGFSRPEWGEMMRPGKGLCEGMGQTA
ncbi:MAG: helicase-related protein [Desulfatirhabdiaceae bacterium]